MEQSSSGLEYPTGLAMVPQVMGVTRGLGHAELPEIGKQEQGRRELIGIVHVSDSIHGSGEDRNEFRSARMAPNL